MVPQSVICIFFLMTAISSGFGWENLPQLPSGKRSEYFVTKNDGGYEYGYDSGSGSFSKQSGQSNNEVSGHFSYPTIEGQLIDIKYTAGVEGYVPYTVTNNNLGTKSSYAYTAGTTKSGSANAGSPPIHQSTGYSYKTTHPSLADHSTNSAAAYSYTNSYGNNVKSNTAEWNASPAQSPAVSVTRHYQSNDEQSTGGDASYNFAYNAGDSSRNEVSDQNGNINGHYSFTNEAGQHDLSYTAGAGTGFVVTGGSLSVPNGIDNNSATTRQYQQQNYHQNQYQQPQQDQQWNLQKSSSENDGSYAFSYNTGDASRQEQSDQSGNIHGQYSFTNEAGQHDLKYIAGADTGFVVTGGSLSVPNGIDSGATGASVKSASTSTTWKSKQFQTPVVVYNVNDEYNQNQEQHSSNSDAAYDFAYKTGDSTRHEKSDSNGRVVGQYSYQNEAGQHDLTYIAGADTGFVVTGGSLSIPNGIDGGATVRQLATTQSINNNQHAAVKSASLSSSSGWANSGKTYIPPSVVSTRTSESQQGVATHGAGGSYSIQYRVGGGESNNYGRDASTGFAVTKLLPTNGNLKFGYILE